MVTSKELFSLGLWEISSPIETFFKSSEEIVPVSFGKICGSEGWTEEDLRHSRNGTSIVRYQYRC